MIRENNKAYHFIAHHGAFQQMQGGRVAQILRLGLNSELACVPEVGANKYAINIRFTVADYAAKSTLVEHDVPFDLNFHSLLIMPTKAPPVVTCPHCDKGTSMGHQQSLSPVLQRTLQADRSGQMGQ